MRRFLGIFLFCGALFGSIRAEVIPFIYDQPLARRPDPLPVNGNLLKYQPAALDDWLNFRINSDQIGQVQNEQQVVVNPQNPQNVVAVWRDFRLGYRRVGVGYSFDGGWTWHDELFPQVIHPWQSDPALTYHTSGTVYACILSYDPSGEDGLFVSASTDGGVNWGPFYPAVNAAPSSFEDKELIACDRTGSPYDGYLYVTWAKFSSTTDIFCVRSTMNGVSWDVPVQVSDSSTVQWPVPAVGPNGEIYVAWVDTGWPFGIQLDKSLDGGMTWGADRVVQPTSFGSAYITPSLLIFAFPAMDVDITNGSYRGHIYVAYTDDWYGDADIFLTRSEDEGRIWSDPIRINDDSQANGCDQFHPWLVCDENGVLHLIFYDRRNDPAQNLLMDLYYTYSTDAGITWSPNERISTVSSNPANDSLDSGLIGEYNGLAVRAGVLHPVWTDTRNLNQDTYTAVWDTLVGIPEKIPTSSTDPLSVHLSASPNPFNEAVQISLTLPTSGEIRLEVYDLAGRHLATLAQGHYEAGTIRRIWTATAGSGIYLLRADTSSGRAFQKIVNVK